MIFRFKKLINAQRYAKTRRKNWGIKVKINKYKTPLKMDGDYYYFFIRVKI